MIYEILTQKTLKALSIAHDEAVRTGHSLVGTAQLLVGLRSEGTGEAARALKSIGLSVKDIRLEIKKIIGRGSGYGYPLPYSTRVANIMRFAVEERTREHGEKFISTGQLLLGLVKEGNGNGYQAILNRGILLHELEAIIVCEIALRPEEP